MAFYVKHKNQARFGLQTDKFCTFRVMDHNFDTLRRFHGNEESENLSINSQRSTYGGLHCVFMLSH